MLYAVHFLSYRQSNFVSEFRKFFSDSPREVCRDFPLSSLCHQPIQASWAIKATKLPRRSYSEASRAIQAARHQERHQLDRERRESREALRRARLYLEERKLQIKKELKDQAVEQHKQPERGNIVKELHTSKKKYYMLIIIEYKELCWLISSPRVIFSRNFIQSVLVLSRVAGWAVGLFKYLLVV